MPLTSMMPMEAQESIGKRQTGISSALRLPSVTASVPILYSPLYSNTPQKAAVLGYTAEPLCPAPTVALYSSTARYSIQPYNALQSTTLYNPPLGSGADGPAAIGSTVPWLSTRADELTSYAS